MNIKTMTVPGFSAGFCFPEKKITGQMCMVKYTDGTSLQFIYDGTKWRPIPTQGTTIKVHHIHEFLFDPDTGECPEITPSIFDVLAPKLVPGTVVWYIDTETCVKTYRMLTMESKFEDITSLYTTLLMATLYGD